MPVRPPDVDKSRAKGSGQKRSRRGFLKALAVSAPAGILGATVAALPRGVSADGGASATADALRKRNLGEALAAKQSLLDGQRQGSLLATLSPPVSAELPVLPAISASLPAEATVVRMQRELKRALEKPIDQRKWAMVIDSRKCIGCSACTIACKAENHLPPGVVYRPVIEEEIGEFPNVSRRWIPRPCQQCEEPPCVEVCPVSATWKREDGIVVIDYKACIGCRYCQTACPYGARYFDFGDNYTDETPAVQPYEKSAAPEYSRSWPRDDESSPIGNVRKCQFCIHRLNAGMLPACVTTCLGNATYFGDKNDPESLVSELIASPRVMRLKEDLGTKPKVYYLV